MLIVRSSNFRESFVKARNNEIPRTYIERKKTRYFRLSNMLADRYCFRNCHAKKIISADHVSRNA